jgi:uncharacterized protein YbbC (DUF1343 family)
MIVKSIVGLFMTLGLAVLIAKESVQPAVRHFPPEKLQTGAERLNAYLPKLKGKKVGLTINHTAIVGETHLLDTLLRLGVDVRRVFVPEHGLRGTADAGEKIQDGKDPQTGVAMASLYGNRRKPAPADLADLDLMIFDIQDVGVRFYTYISTLHYVMEACAEQGLPLMVLDRPNPNGHFVDGPILDTAYRSFVGMHPVPVVHGMTVGEYAQMVNGEGWLKGGVTCKLEVVKCSEYTHQTPYVLPRKPSPNLPNMRAIYLYPSICYFEGTQVSVGRGTDKQFQVLGTPGFPIGDYTFTPEPKEGAMQPFLQGKPCRGYDLTSLDPEEIRGWGKIHLDYLIHFYQNYPEKDSFFLKGMFIDKLAGGASLRTQLVQGWNEDKIRASWEPALSQYKVKRKQYLLYKD